jgi:hypothetical protein
VEHAIRDLADEFVRQKGYLLSLWDGVPR